MKPLILIGGGGHCKSVIEAAESAGYSILGVLDMPEDVGKEILLMIFHSTLTRLNLLLQLVLLRTLQFA